jgi:hypothetical protein
MEVYSYNQETFEYIGTTIAFESPLEPGTYHYPAHTTTIVPPTNNDPEHKMITWDKENKKWSILDRPPREKTIEELRQEDIDNFVPPTAMELLRAQRDKKLKNIDWMVTRYLTTTGTIPEELKNYMQQLRDIPEHTNPRMIQESEMFYVLDPESVVWPEIPLL